MLKMLDDEVSPQYNVVISFGNNPEYDFGIFAKGYRQAADILCGNFFSKTSFGDYEAYPIIFLYRHAFELSLKNIIYKAGRISGGSDDDILHHNLSDLATKIKGNSLIVNLCSSDVDIQDLIKRIEILAKEFTKIDSNSFAYRYPIDKKKKIQHSTKKHQVVNIESLYEEMNIILNDLEILDLGLTIEYARLQKIHHEEDDVSL